MKAEFTHEQDGMMFYEIPGVMTFDIPKEYDQEDFQFTVTPADEVHYEPEVDNTYIIVRQGSLVLCLVINVDEDERGFAIEDGYLLRVTDPETVQ